MSRAVPVLVAGLVAVSCASLAQTPATPAPAAPSTSAPAPSPTPSSGAYSSAGGSLEALGALVKDGKLDVEADLVPGSVPAIPKYALEVQGSPKTSIQADAANGRVTHMTFVVSNGRLVVRGQGLRPKVAIESLEFQDPKGITEMKFRGLGIWRPIVAIFGGIARSAVRKMEFRTDIPSVMKGEILGGKRPAPASSPSAGAGASSAAAPSPTPTPASAAGGPPPAPTPSFMDLVREVRINEMTLTAFEGHRMELRPFVTFETASKPQSGDAMRVSIDRGVFRPGRAGAPAFIDFAGRLDGEIEDGRMEFEKNECTIVHGRIRGGQFRAAVGEDGKLATALSAESLAFELSSGKFVVPGGLGVDLDSGSTFEVSNVHVTSDGKFSGVARLDLAGKTGDLSRKGATISASDIRLKTPGITVVNGRATGPLELSFDYVLEYPFDVKYPIEQIPEKKLMLDFHGPFSTTLRLQDAGGDEGEVTGTYVFKAPWAPIEQAALAALAAKWRQDLAIKNVDFAIVPKRFRPCGESCFTLAIEFTAEKRAQKGLKKLFSQFCAPVGRAILFVNKPERSFELHDVKIETHCKGLVGAVVNFLSPFLTKSYTNMKLFQMPPNLPLTIDSVRGGAEWVEIAGTVDWQAGDAKPEVPPAPQPVTVPPGE